MLFVVNGQVISVIKHGACSVSWTYSDSEGFGPLANSLNLSALRPQ